MSNVNASAERLELIRGNLARTSYGAFSTFDKDGAIDSRFMLFANTESMDTFYMMTELSTTKVAEITARPEGTLAILSSVDKIEETCETFVQGSMSVLVEFSDARVQEALQLLMKKMPMVKGLYDSGTLGNYGILMLRSRMMKSGLYMEILQQKPSTIVKFG